MKQYVPMSGEYFLYMTDEESHDTVEDAVERAKTLLARRPGDHYMIMKVEKILKATKVDVTVEDVGFEGFSAEQDKHKFSLFDTNEYTDSGTEEGK